MVGVFTTTLVALGHRRASFSILSRVKSDVSFQTLFPPKLAVAYMTGVDPFTTRLATMLSHHVVAHMFRAGALLLTEGATILVPALLVVHAHVDFETKRRAEQAATHLAQMLVATVHPLVPLQADRAPESARAPRALVFLFLVRLHVPVHHGSFEERLAAHGARNPTEHEVLRAVLVKIRFLVESLAALEAVESVLAAAAATRLLNGLQHPRVAVAEVLCVI